MNPNPRRSGLLPRLGIGAGLLLASLPALASNTVESTAQAASLAQRQPLIVGSVSDVYPYSYIDSDGRLKGFASEILDAVARAVNIQIQRVNGPAAQVRERFVNGEFDILEYHAVSSRSLPYAEFSLPFLSIQGCVFVRQDGPIHDLKDLEGKPFAMMGTSGQGEKLLRDNNINARVVMEPSQESMLQKVSSGEADGCFVSQLTELSITTRRHITNLRMLGRPYNGYEIQQAFAVHTGDSELLSRLNEGLALIHHSGEYDRIYRENFSQYGSYILSAQDLELYASVVLGVAFMAALWGYIRQRKLRKELTGQAAKLAEQGALLHALYDNIPMAMTVIETGSGPHRVLSMNRQAVSLYSLDFPRIGHPLETLQVPPDIRKHLLEATARLPGEPIVTTRETLLKNGKRLLEITAVPLIAANGVSQDKICVLVEDITDRRQQEAEVARSRKLRAVGELVGGIAHEFNNLLTPVMLKAGEIQMSRPDDAELQRDVDVIAQAVQRTAELTRRLLTFGRKAEHRAETVRLSTIAAGCFDLLKHTVDRRIEWEHVIPPGLAPLYFNATDLNQILLNLLLNAKDALMERLSGRNAANWTPKISVEASQLPPEAYEVSVQSAGKTLIAWQLLVVSDNGLGMAPDVVERIFEPFFTTKDVGKGTGLGLATVWHLVNDAGGQVKVESTLGVGSAFSIVLPVWPSAEKIAEAKIAKAAEKAVRVLLVEDEALVSKPIMQVLAKNGHQVTHFENGLDAWKHLETNLGSYELLIIDVNLPGMNGIDVVARAREHDFQGRIFMVSGRFTSADMSALTRLRIDHSLTKPFNVQQFLQAVNKSLAGA
ncbi:MAG TPA: transporter substrate-binding domain-containing protein [Opitutaceae bacterium]|jgi:signal transduction histidine kinase/ABC-type amino acid transport substrate-binding protein/CheY-like chemotaxis protein|nr:transporter substrate-binding domain-containing protein [Opitutaceae bacterium]